MISCSSSGFGGLRLKAKSSWRAVDWAGHVGVHSLPEHSMIFVKIWSRRSTTSSDSSAMEALEASTCD